MARKEDNVGGVSRQSAYPDKIFTAVGYRFAVYYLIFSTIYSIIIMSITVIGQEFQIGLNFALQNLIRFALGVSKADVKCEI